MENNEYQLEKNKLLEVIEKYSEVIENYELLIKALPRTHSNNKEHAQQLFYEYKKKLEVLNKTLEKPYFARIDFKSDDLNELEICYIGKVGVFDSDDNLITVDWRAPIASMYYDSNVGKTFYKAPEGTITGELTIKRQYDIKNGILNNYKDVDTVSNDEILKPYLGVQAEARLKNIVASIQSEQNEIIRDKLNKNLIIQGVAGSGKTTVALHRIAYLVYNNKKYIKPDQYMVIGPNKFFINYISTVLPDLDVNNVSQLTFDELVNEAINEDLILISPEIELIDAVKGKNQDALKYKCSLDYKKDIDTYLEDFDKNFVPIKNFNLKGFTILDYEIIKKIYDEVDKKHYYNFNSRKERACLLLSSYIQNNLRKIQSKITNFFYDELKNQNDKDKFRKDFEAVKKELNTYCKQSLKKHFTKSCRKVTLVYTDFLKSEYFKLKVDKKNTIKNLKANKVSFEDLSALLYIEYKLRGNEKYKKYRHIVIDEAQDFGEFNFYILRMLNSNSTFSIFGDLAQSIFDYRSINNWQVVIDNVFKGNCETKKLLKSYRTTTQIMEEANNITRHINLDTAVPVIRNGNNVIKKTLESIDEIVNDILTFQDKGHKSIAIIGKDALETTIINNQLKEKGIKIKNIASADEPYKGGICTIPSYLAKGLEFDGVIIYDASENNYRNSSKTEMKLLYVAMTRALHDLKIYYHEELTKPIKNRIN